LQQQEDGRMKFHALVLTCVLVTHWGVAGTVDGTAQAGSAGKRGSASSQPGVVWLDGARKFSIPRKIPALTQHNSQFIPRLLIVVAGQTVQMVNEDQIAHGAYSDSSVKKFNLGYYAQGTRRSVTFDRPGVVDVRCPLHSEMRGTILVVPSPYYATVESDGTFHIGNIPPRQVHTQLLE
jgi:plastocyanin